MKLIGGLGPAEKFLAATTQRMNSIKEQLPKFHPTSKRHEFAACFLGQYEEFKKKLEQEYIKLKGKESPPLPQK